MKRKRMMQRALSLLLACLLIVGAPLSVLAEDALIIADVQAWAQESSSEVGESASGDDLLLEDVSLTDADAEETVGVPSDETLSEEMGEVSSDEVLSEETDDVSPSDETTETETDIAGGEAAEAGTEAAATDGTEPESESGLELLPEELLVEEIVEDAAYEVEENSLEAGTYTIESASELPSEIPEGVTIGLANDITLDADQQITTLSGVLDGKGHAITLNGKPLADTVNGTIQNLGVTSAATLSGSGIGSMAVTLNGTIRNCYSTVAVAVDTTWKNVNGGLAGTLNGTVRNSYYTGSNGQMNGGIAGSAGSVAAVYNSYYTEYTPFDYGITPAAGENYGQKTADDFQDAAILDLLNKDMEGSGGLVWGQIAGTNNGYPVLMADTGEVDKSGLEAVIAEAKGLDESIYSADSWSSLQEALAAAAKVAEDENAVQADVNSASNALKSAISALVAVAPVAPPADESEIVYISSASEFASAAQNDYFNDTTHYYVLTQDITVDSSYTSKYIIFNGVLDGQGHTITFNNGTAFVSRVETGGVVQNVNFAGQMGGSSSNKTAPLGTAVYGSVFNCRSEVTGDYAAGFTLKLGTDSYGNVGVMSNCLFVGDAGLGGLYQTLDGGIANNCYALGTLSDSELKTTELVAKLNAGRGANGVAWGQGSDGYPYFGEDQEYTGEDTWPELPETSGAYQIAFKKNSEDTPQTLTDSRLLLNPDEVTGTKIAGVLSLVDYEAPEGSSLQWEITYKRPSSAFGIVMDDSSSMEAGTLMVYSSGKAVVTAKQINSDGTTESLAAVSINATTKTMEEIRLLVDGVDVTNGSVALAGSEDKLIKVQARYEGEEEWTDVANSAFTFTVSEADREKLYSLTDSFSTIQFVTPGTAAITVTSRLQSELSATVTATSSYVAVESVVPAISGTHIVHARNANSDGQEADGRVAFNPILGSAIVTPANATNAGNVEIVSADETIAYYESGEKAYIPKEAGTVTFTATIEDENPLTGETNVVTGTSDVTFEYKNHVTSVALSSGLEQPITVKAGETYDFDVDVAGELDAEGWSVTEPALKWTYSAAGVAKIVRKGSGAWKRDESAPDNNCYVPVASYQVMGLSEGTVTATGTPLDDQNDVAPITVVIQVEAGDGENLDIDQVVSDGADGAVAYISGNHSESGYSYGNEWLIYSLLSGDSKPSEETLDAYYASVVSEVRTWTENQKPTDIERVVLALAKMGKDVTAVGAEDGNPIDLAAMIYNSPLLSTGSNELIYALLALDAADITIPSDAKWSRTAIIEELLKFQCEDGGFGLSNNRSSSVDMTAMALQALANYRTRPAVAAAIDRGIEYLKAQQRDDFGYGNAESTAQVLIALSILGIDPTLPADGFGSPNFNIVTNLMEYKMSDGGFAHLTNYTASQEMPTVQVLQALQAYQAGAAYWNINGTKVNVTFSLLGDSAHDSDADETYHALHNENLETWIGASEYRMAEGTTVMDLLDQMLADNGMTAVKKYNDTYVSAIIRNGAELAEFTNGRKSGWMYTVNGEHPEVGAAEYQLKEGDTVVFHYTDNYELEYMADGDHVWKNAWSSDAAAHWHECADLKCPITDNTQKDGYAAHTPGDWIVDNAATGAKHKECVVCGYVTETAAETAAEHTSHSFGEWTTVTAATVSAAEMQQRTCTVCGFAETRTVGEPLTPVLEVPGELNSFSIKNKTTVKFALAMAEGDSVVSVKSANPKKVQVKSYNADGSVTLKAKKKGTAKITVTLASGKTRTYKVKSTPKVVKTKKITGVAKTLTLKKGGSMKLNPVLTPFTSTQKLTYASSNKKVAKVSAKGKITAGAAGTATITVKSGAKSVKCKVTVK